jgi:hypothetical protein
MRSLLTLLVLAIALLAGSANAWAPISKKDAEICGKKNPDIAQAIGAFCQRAPYVSSNNRNCSASSGAANLKSLLGNQSERLRGQRRIKKKGRGDSQETK